MIKIPSFTHKQHIFFHLKLVIVAFFSSTNLHAHANGIDYLGLYQRCNGNEFSEYDLTDSLFTACDDGFACLEDLENFLSSKPFSQSKIHGLIALATIANSKEKYKESINFFDKALIQAKYLNSPKTGNIYSNLAVNYIASDKIDKSLYYNHLAMEYFFSNQMKDAFWMPYFNLYTIHKKLKNNSKALEYLKQSYGLTNPQRRMDKGYTLFTLVNELKSSGSKIDLDKYLSEYVTFKKSGSKPITNPEHLGLDEWISGDTSFYKILEDKIKNSKNVKITYALKDYYYNLAKIYIEKGQLDKAENVLSDSELKGFQKDKDFIWLQYQINKYKNNFEAAAINLSEITAIQDSMSRQKYEQALAEFEAKFDTANKEKELIKKQFELSTTYGLLIGLGAILLVSFIFYYYRMKQHKLMSAQEQLIQHQKIKQLEQENKLLSLNAMIEGQELERLRIAQDLHDGLGGLLTTVKAHFNIIKKEIENIEQLNVYAKTNQLIDEACTEVRRIAHDMVPHSIKISGLPGALDDLKQSLLAHNIFCDLDIHGFENNMLSDQQSNMIYRILQELISNIIKHAVANKVFIQLMVHDKELHITVEDDGKGFNFDKNIHTGIGLRSIQSRVDYLGGSIHYDSSPDHGTTVMIKIGLT